MTAMASEHYICDHERTTFEFRKDILFSDTDCYTARLGDSADGTSKESAVFDTIENAKNLFPKSFIVLAEEMRNAGDAIDA